jgi:hypothetical protein
MTTRVSILLLVLLGGGFAGLWSSPGGAAPLGSAFSYQGRLSEGGAPAHGLYDLRFGLFTNAVGGEPMTALLTNAAVNVSTDSSPPPSISRQRLAGANGWLEIAVPAGLRMFVTLVPRKS